jgi:hypothetical protein
MTSSQVTLKVASLVLLLLLCGTSPSSAHNVIFDKSIDVCPTCSVSNVIPTHLIETYKFGDCLGQGAKNTVFALDSDHRPALVARSGFIKHDNRTIKLQQAPKAMAWMNSHLSLVDSSVVSLLRHFLGVKCPGERKVKDLSSFAAIEGEAWATSDAGIAGGNSMGFNGAMYVLDIQIEESSFNALVR